MGRRGIGFDEVAEAAEAVLRSGENPTVARIRSTLGDTGSNLTISKYLNDWKNARLNKEPQKLPWTVEVPEALQRSVGEVWSQMCNVARNDAEKIKQEATETVNKVWQENNQLRQEKQQLKEALDEARLTINHLQTDLKLKEGQLIEERKNSAVLEERSNRSDATLVKLQAEMTSRMMDAERLHEENISVLKAQLIKSEEILTEQQIQAENQRQQLIVQMDHYRTAKEKSENSLSKLQIEVKQKDILLKERGEMIRGLQADVKVLKQKCNDMEDLYRNSERLGQGREAKIAQLQIEQENKEEIIFQLKQMIEILQSRFNQTRIET